MTTIDPTIEKTIYVYQENHIIRTGRLGYYDALLMSDLSGSILSNLNTVTGSEVVPATDPTTHTLTSGINAIVKDLTVEA